MKPKRKFKFYSKAQKRLFRISNSNIPGCWDWKGGKIKATAKNKRRWKAHKKRWIKAGMPL